MFLLSAPRQQLARLPLAVVGFTGFGVLTAFALDESVRPSLDFTKLAICVVIGVVVLASHRPRAGPRPSLALKSALTGAGVGWLIGAWGGGDVGNGNLTGVMYATVMPAAILGVRFGLTRAEATRRRRIEQKSRAWIFLTPALLFMFVGLVVPLIKTIYQSFRNRDNSEFVGLENYRADLQRPELVQPRQLEQLRHQSPRRRRCAGTGLGPGDHRDR